MRGSAVVLLAHVRERSGLYRSKSTKPMGNTAISAAARWRVRVIRKSGGDRIALICDGNSALGATYNLQRGDGETDLRVLEGVGERQDTSRRHKRNAEAAQRLSEIADWALASVPGERPAERRTLSAVDPGGVWVRRPELPVRPRPWDRTATEQGHADGWCRYPVSAEVPAASRGSSTTTAVSVGRRAAYASRFLSISDQRDHSRSRSAPVARRARTCRTPSRVWAVASA